MCAAAVRGKPCGVQHEGRMSCKVGLPEVCTRCAGWSSCVQLVFDPSCALAAVARNARGISMHHSRRLLQFSAQNRKVR